MQRNTVGIAVLLSLLGMLLVFGGAFVFFPQAPELPVFGDGDWPGVIVMILGACWALFGAFQYLRFGRSKLTKALLVLIALISTGAAAGTSWWVLDYSYRVPAPARLEATHVPGFELKDQNGEIVSDETLSGRPYVMIFGRGVW